MSDTPVSRSSINDRPSSYANGRVVNFVITQEAAEKHQQSEEQTLGFHTPLHSITLKPDF